MRTASSSSTAGRSRRPAASTCCRPLSTSDCLHYGLLTFRYRGDSEVSRVAYQVSHETCYYFQFDAWGAAAATRGPDAAIDGAAIGGNEEGTVPFDVRDFRRARGRGVEGDSPLRFTRPT
jgi:hypothetical protein